MRTTMSILVLALGLSSAACDKKQNPASPPSDPPPMAPVGMDAMGMDAMGMDAMGMDAMGMTPTKTVPGPGSIPVLAGMAGAPDRFACKKDSDCRVGCMHDGTCCLSHCLCSSVYSAKFLAALQRHQGSLCRGGRPQCSPGIVCGAPAYRWMPKCDRGKCTKVKK